MKLSTNY